MNNATLELAMDITAALAGKLGTLNVPGSAVYGAASGFALSYTGADWGSTDNGKDNAGNYLSAGSSLVCPSDGLPGTGGLNAGYYPDPSLRKGIGVLWSIVASVDNTLGTNPVHLDAGAVGMSGMPAAWVQCQSPTIPFSGGSGKPASVITIAPGAWEQFTLTGGYLFLGQNAPTLVGLPSIKLRSGESALLHLQCLGWFIGILRGPNPGGNIGQLQSVNQIFE